MQKIYNHVKFIKFLVLREKNLRRLYEDDYEIFLIKLSISQKLTHLKRLELEALNNRVLKEFGEYTHHYVYKPTKKQDYEKIVASISYMEFMRKQFIKEIKKIKGERNGDN